MKFNTAVAIFMTMVNEFYKEKTINKAEYKTFLQLLNPFAPHITEELYSQIGETKTINETPWPTYDEDKVVDDEVNIPVQVNGKLKTLVKVDISLSDEEIKDIIKQDEKVKSILEGLDVKKEIYVPGKIFNIVGTKK